MSTLVEQYFDNSSCEFCCAVVSMNFEFSNILTTAFCER